MFEVVSTARKRLAAEIKQAYRTNKRQESKRKEQIIYASRKKIIPLEPIPIAKPKVINTSFTVKVRLCRFDYGLILAMFSGFIVTF